MLVNFLLVNIRLVNYILVNFLLVNIGERSKTGTRVRLQKFDSQLRGGQVMKCSSHAAVKCSWTFWHFGATFKRGLT